MSKKYYLVEIEGASPPEACDKTMRRVLTYDFGNAKAWRYPEGMHPTALPNGSTEISPGTKSTLCHAASFNAGVRPNTRCDLERGHGNIHHDPALGPWRFVGGSDVEFLS